MAFWYYPLVPSLLAPFLPRPPRPQHSFPLEFDGLGHCRIVFHSISTASGTPVSRSLKIRRRRTLPPRLRLKFDGVGHCRLVSRSNSTASDTAVSLPLHTRRRRALPYRFPPRMRRRRTPSSRPAFWFCVVLRAVVGRFVRPGSGRQICIKCGIFFVGDAWR